MNDTHDAIIYVLEQCYPNETGFAGYGVIEDIIDEVKFESSEASSNIDLTAVIAILATTVASVKTILDIYILLRDKLKRPPKHSEIKQKLHKQKLDIASKQDADKLIDALINYYLEKNEQFRT